MFVTVTKETDNTCKDCLSGLGFTADQGKLLLDHQMICPILADGYV
jgi:hypothetical protein